MGNSAQDCAQALTEGGACAVGANCGNLDPFEMSEIVSRIREATSLPVLAQPNAGKPRLVENRTVFDMSPSDFAAEYINVYRPGLSWLEGAAALPQRTSGPWRHC